MMMKIGTILKYMNAVCNDDLLSPHVYFSFQSYYSPLVTSINLQGKNLKSPVFKSAFFF